MKYYSYKYGCTMNVAETEEVEIYMQQIGISPADHLEYSDIIYIGTCGVVQTTELKMINKIQSLIDSYPEKKIIVGGCLPGMMGAELRKKFPTVLFFTPTQKNKLWAELDKLEKTVTHNTLGKEKISSEKILEQIIKILN